jgi:hypothetical protein
MADCPLCDEWRYDATAAAICVRVIGDWLPVIYRDGQLRRAWPSEPPGGWSAATAAHICHEHPMDPSVILLGPLEDYAPLGGLTLRD